MMAPLAPHIAEELWERMGEPYSVHRRRGRPGTRIWHSEDEITLVVQVNGKVRDRIQVATGIDEATAREKAMVSPQVKRHLEGQQIRRVVYVPGKLVNIVLE